MSAGVAVGVLPTSFPWSRPVSVPICGPMGASADEGSPHPVKDLVNAEVACTVGVQPEGGRTEASSAECAVGRTRVSSLVFRRSLPELLPQLATQDD